MWNILSSLVTFRIARSNSCNSHSCWQWWWSSQNIFKNLSLTVLNNSISASPTLFCLFLRWNIFLQCWDEIFSLLDQWVLALTDKVITYLTMKWLLLPTLEGVSSSINTIIGSAKSRMIILVVSGVTSGMSGPVKSAVWSKSSSHSQSARPNTHRTGENLFPGFGKLLILSRNGFK